ncbi:helix-turn-helix transcriptional regulator [Oscillibacter sp.]|uniref:helix-turn-helix domain-containing protein n=1 Tax=Oscillibacter sp. TaxID=1945593 RepID=UPI00289D9DB6|nr:helix-turn-helix transcriptional regulator [Oscillibacter sp.]
MAIGERIRFIRNLRGMTQKYLGMAIGFTEKTADVRMAQYESGARTPKESMTADLANVLGVCSQALAVPDIDSDIGLMHTLFALEDLRGLKVSELDGELCLRLDKSKGMTYVGMLEMLSAWHEQAAKLEAGEITQEEYDKWRYNYPKFDTSQRWAKVPSQEVSNAFLDTFKDLSKDD